MLNIVRKNLKYIGEVAQTTSYATHVNILILIKHYTLRYNLFYKEHSTTETLVFSILKFKSFKLPKTQKHLVSCYASLKNSCI